MRVGVSLTSSHTVADPREGARWMIERAAAAERAGLDSLFVGDHHATPGPYYQNVPMLARMLAEWTDRPAGCLFLLPLWNPVLVAEQVGTLAAIARGRFIFQCGLGDGLAQFLAMGANIKQRPSAFEEAFGIVKRLLAGETVSSQGRFVLENARVTPRPAEPVEYWIGASARVSIDRAARIADGWLASPGLTIAGAREQVGVVSGQLRQVRPEAVGGRDQARHLCRRVVGRGGGVGRGHRQSGLSRLRSRRARLGLDRGGRRQVPRPRAPRLYRRHRPAHHRQPGEGSGFPRPPRRSPEGARHRLTGGSSFCFFPIPHRRDSGSV